jgi:hypothetical protein
MDIQQSSYLAVEVHLATLDARRKECALAYIKNGPSHPQTVRLNKASDTNAVSDFHLLCHSRVHSLG